MRLKKIMVLSLFTASILQANTGEELFKNHCSSCHSEILGVDESGGKVTNIYGAPYVKDVVKKLKEETKTQDEFVSFIKDYINIPSKRKSLYGKRAIKQFGLMPSLSGLLSDKESTKLATYLYNDIIKKEVKIEKIKKLVKKQGLFETYCSSCHSEVLGVDESGGKVTNIYGAPYVKDIVKKLKEETKTQDEFVSFIKDYINIPSKRKSLYSKKAIKQFGLMPSLNGVLSDKEITQLANDLYKKY